MPFIDYGVGILFLAILATFSVLSWIALVALSRRYRKQEQGPRQP